MLDWIADRQVYCWLPNETPLTMNLSPVVEESTSIKGVVIPISEYESILIEARIKSEYDNLIDDQEGILVYRSDTRIRGGEGPLTIISSKNEWTSNPALLDDVERFKYGTLRMGERVNYKNVFVEYTERKGKTFTITIAQGEQHFILKAETEAMVKAEANAKAEAEAKAEAKVKADAEAKVAAELKARQEAEAKAKAEAAAKKKSTITCVKGKLTKKVTAVNPKCPRGYKEK
jgi:hypothetical protein